MRLQRKSWTCGPASVVNAARSIGVRIAENRISKIAGSSEEYGTDDIPLMNGIRGVGLTAEQFLTQDKKAAWAFVRSSLSDGRPLVICVDNYEHWISAIGSIGDRIIIADPSNTKTNIRENGIHSLSKRDFMKRWLNKKTNEYFAIAIGKKK